MELALTGIDAFKKTNDFLIKKSFGVEQPIINDNGFVGIFRNSEKTVSIKVSYTIEGNEAHDMNYFDFGVSKWIENHNTLSGGHFSKEYDSTEFEEFEDFKRDIQKFL